jgi:serpin B
MTPYQSLTDIFLAAQLADTRPSPGVAAQAISLFGLRLTAELVAARPDKNVFISPLSVFLALAMAGNGAGGETKSAMWSTLALPPVLTVDELNSSIAALSKLLKSQKGVEISIANALWASLAFHFSKEYAARCEAAFQARVTTLDFHRPEAALAINEWVSEKTKGKIPEIVSSEAISNADVVLTNAIYFRGKWDNPFQKPLTKPMPFHLADGRCKDVQMMRNPRLSHAYRETTAFECAELQYENSLINMQVLLPKACHTADEVLRTLDWQGLRSQKATADVDLSMPRFTLDFSGSLRRPLQRMGMDIAFKSPPADFTEMGSKDFFIGEVIHKTRLEVDEEGTIAAAATGLGMTMAACSPVELEMKILVFDKPFVVLMAEARTGTLLFAGLVEEPQ